MKAVVLFSGGKDSCLALHKAIQEGYEIERILAVIPKGKDAWMFHTPNIDLIKKQAKELGFKFDMVSAEIGEKKELESLTKLLNKIKGKADVLVIGGIASSYQGKRIKAVADKIDLKVYAPLWDYTPEKLWNELLDNKFEVVLIKIACEGIPKDFLGKIITEKELNELKTLSEKYKFRLDFEGGEAETAVLFMPEFKNHIKISYVIENKGSYRYFLNIKVVE